MNGKKKQGPLANFGPDAVPSDEDVPMGVLPDGIEEKVLEEVGSLQYRAVMSKLEKIEQNIVEIKEMLATFPHIQNNKKVKK